MSERVDRMLAAEDAAVGRVIPKWRYWTVYFSVIAAYLGGTITASADLYFWWKVPVISVPLGVMILALHRYKRQYG